MCCTCPRSTVNVLNTTAGLWGATAVVFDTMTATVIGLNTTVGSGGATTVVFDMMTATVIGLNTTVGSGGATAVVFDTVTATVIGLNTTVGSEGATAVVFDAVTATVIGLNTTVGSCSARNGFDVRLSMPTFDSSALFDVTFGYAAPVFCLPAIGCAAPVLCQDGPNERVQPDRVELSRWPATLESNSIESTSIESASIESTTIESNSIESRSSGSRWLTTVQLARQAPVEHDRFEYNRVAHDRLDSRLSRTRSPGLAIESSTIESNTIEWTHDLDRMDSRSNRTGSPGLTIESNTIESNTNAWTHDRVEHNRLDSRSSRTRSPGLTFESNTTVLNTVDTHTITWTYGRVHASAATAIESNMIELACYPLAEQDRVDRGHYRDRIEHDRARFLLHDVHVVDHTDKFWMLDWVGEIGQPSSGLVLYVVIKENIVPVGGLVRWTGQNMPSATFELTMVLNGRGERIPSVKHVALRWAKYAGLGKSLVDVFNPPRTAEVTLPDLVDVLGFFNSNVIAGEGSVVHPENRISKPKCVLSKTVETGSSVKIRDTPPGPKVGQIGEKGPCRGLVVPSIRDTSPGPRARQIGEKGLCRGLVVPSAPMKTKPTKAPIALGSRPRYVAATKGPLPLVGQQRYDYVVPGRAEKDHEYFEDEDEENSEEYSERGGGPEQYAAGVDGMTRHPRETSKVVGQDEDSEHTMSELGGEVGLAGGYGSSYEGCFFLELDERGNQCPDMEFISVQFDRILDIPDGEFRYNQRYLVQQTINDIYDAMVASGEAAIGERTTGAAGVNVCTLYEKPVLLLVALRDTLHTDASGRIVRARRVMPDEFDLEFVNKYYYYPLSGQHNVVAARRCFVERPDITHELRLNRWTARPVYYPDKSMDNYGTLSTFQNAKDKLNTPPHQIVVILNIRKLWHESNGSEAKGGSAAEVKNADYKKFAGEALRLTRIRNLVDMSLTTQWSGQWSDALGPYMLLARVTDDVFEKVKQVYAAWEAGQLSGRDAVKPATKQGESGKAPRAGPGFGLRGGVRYPVHWVQGTKGPGYLVAVHDPNSRACKPFSALGRHERLQLLRYILTGSVILTPKQSEAAQRAGKHSTETYVEMVKIERAMLRMFHYFVFISDPHRKSSEWTESFFNNLSDLFDKYSDEGLTSERWIDQRRLFKDMNWVRTSPATLRGEEEKGEEGFKKTASLAAKCPEEFVQFVNKLLHRSETRASTPTAERSSGEQAGDLSALVRRERRPKMLANVVEKNFTPTKLKMAGMEPREKFAYEGMEKEPNAMVETLEHFCLADEAVIFLGKSHAALIWELLKNHRHCIVLEGEGMKFEFLVQFVTKMVKSGLYFANFVKPPPRHDEKRDLVYKVGQNIVNIWEFLFETKPQNRGERAYVVRR
ncbi:hypothetical protein CBR_g31842 [Chara braunii]|uniref:Uncharacterized protein n=1 Tax=Chara braunii TaxID=69332 RepID=A0A388LFS4_CHABU|nr:hypothetical protein CBR_g31842 [Chara braunii]|eukprot:GBG81166.1 hypothetical protein CBR_g31842 [Chara braunii]